ncbi:two-component response regulator 24-like [Phoenix dactylifera]|uniref:Two-component response regulator 24-like n=1 Tax=Phoenix dactylifera TaxID=42345 RepID=A0A8B7D4I1_PHODC|nr:two-component response regulator 24-like [Phoenix dactylifera]
MATSSSSTGVDKLKNKLRALVVDDNRMIRLYMVSLLKKANVEAEVAEDGKAAVNCFLQGKTYDIILMDKDMPQMDGVQATRILREMGVKTKIVGVTSHSTEEEKREFLEAGLDDFFVKPLTSPQLIELLKDVGNK